MFAWNRILGPRRSPGDRVSDTKAAVGLSLGEPRPRGKAGPSDQATEGRWSKMP